MSKFVDEAMTLADSMADKACAGSLHGFLHVERNDLQSHLTAREALLDRMAEALKELIAAGDDYKNPFADDIQKIIRFRHADEEACAVLDAYEGSKQ